LAEELAERVGKQLPAGASGRLLETASFLQAFMDRRNLVDALYQIFNVDFPPGRVHQMLASLPGEPLIITTNWDCFIERAFDETGRPYHLVVNSVQEFHNWQERELPRALWRRPGSHAFDWVGEFSTFEGYPIIFKIHGSMGLPFESTDTFVITEEDYYRMAGREHLGSLIPRYIRGALAHRGPVVFLGYGLGDIHIRHAIRRRGGGR
jgi:hypothetical protein